MESMGTMQASSSMSQPGGIRQQLSSSLLAGMTAKVRPLQKNMHAPFAYPLIFKQGSEPCMMDVPSNC